LGVISLFAAFIARLVAAFDTRNTPHLGWICGVFGILSLSSILYTWHIFLIQVSDAATVFDVMRGYTKSLPAVNSTPQK
jgi:hypothetical protein